MLVRYLLVALVVVAAAIFLIAPFATSFVEHWTQRDVELRASLVFNSVRDELEALLDRRDTKKIDDLFNRLALDERLLAVGFCDDAGALQYRSKLMPPEFSCKKIAGGKGNTVSVGNVGDSPVIIASFPFSRGAANGHLVLIHDMTFAERRAAQAQIWITVALAGLALVGVILAAVIGLLVMRGWLDSLKKIIDDMRTGRASDSEAAGGPAFGSKVRELLRELEDTRRSVDAAQIDWNPETLRLTLANQLPNAQIIVVSNREPYIHNRTQTGVTLQIPASGLVAAIEPVMRACGGTWIAHGSGSADRELVDTNDRIRVPPDLPAYSLRRVWLSDDEQDGYYYGFANEGLWPLCHLAFVRPNFRESDWDHYRAVNERFADAVLERGHPS